jgi:hypothetical protein
MARWEGEFDDTAGEAPDNKVEEAGKTGGDVEKGDPQGMT